MAPGLEGDIITSHERSWTRFDGVHSKSLLVHKYAVDKAYWSPPISTNENLKRKLALKNCNHSKACHLRKRLGLHCMFVLRTIHTCDVGCVTDICICLTFCYSQNGNLESCCAQPGGDIIISHKISNHHVLKFSFKEPQVRIDLTNDMILPLSEHLLLLRRST